MKRLFFAFIALVAFASVACEKIDDLLTFYINHDEEIVIKSYFPVGTVAPISPIPVTTNSSENFKNNKTQAELVKDVTLNKLELVITDPQTENFNFLKKIEIYISAEGKPEIKIAYLEQVPQNVSKIELTSTNAKLDEYIKGDTYTIGTRATLAKAVTKDVTIKANMRFKVTADPL
ncbi:hypothetical protein ABID22_000276 [Pontibacter aydingkolensis]|uniref:Uncharacterized protein n=1 Tax=Pontibacter aydingkolensis TaxID=1911536 RepID=A0ABS7CQK4_9BACT|nr:hypothetical protein [Pontibacter aydingkolensis]MBW7466058.1 hypothetical protein [Pontibacter aydingkolensis]